MILKKEYSAVQVDYNNLEDFDKLSFAIKQLLKNSIKKPKILINVNSKFLSLALKLKKFANVKVCENCCIGIFSYITHFGEYNLGVFCSDDGFVKFVSGSGYVLSPQQFSVIENATLMKQENEKIKTLPCRIKISNFLELEQGNADSFCQKWSKNYVKHFKKCYNNINIKIVFENSLLNYLFKGVFLNGKKDRITIYSSSKCLYVYKNDVLQNITNIILSPSVKIFNEYQMFKNCIENKIKSVFYNNKIYVADNTFVFEPFSQALFVANYINNIWPNFVNMIISF